jgi:uncharacterized membrane protein YhhN
MGGMPMGEYMIAIVLLAVVTILLIRAEFSGNKKRIYLFKPLATTLVIIVALLSFLTTRCNPQYTIAIIIGLLFSFGGDIALMFKSKRAFMIGLISFLFAHIAYAITFTLFSGFWSGDYLSGVIIILISIAVYAYLYSGLESMKIPVLLYIIIIGFMLSRGISTFSGLFFNETQAVLISIGAGLFYISDLILAVNRFKMPFRYNRISLAFYYSGQLLIALSTGFFAL